MFEGRDTESATLADLWLTHPVTVLHGPPGAGKTSLIRAGVVPRLRLLGKSPLPIGALRGEPVFPEAAVVPANRFALSLVRSWSPDTDLPLTSVGRFLDDLSTAPGAAGPVLAAIDQAEDLFRGGRDAERAEVLQTLSRAVSGSGRARLLLCVRDDRLDPLLAGLEVPRTGIARLALDDLPPSSAVAAIRGPLRLAGRPIGQSAAESLVDGLTRARMVSESGARVTARLGAVHPWQLQAVCAELWRTMTATGGGPGPGTGTDTVPSRGALDIDAALEKAVWSAVGTVAAAFDRDPARLCGWLAKVFIAPDGTARRVEERPDETAGVPNTVLDALVGRSLLKVEAAERVAEADVEAEIQTAAEEETEAGRGVRAYVIRSERLLEPLGAPALRAGLASPPEMTADGLLRAAVEALTDGDDARAGALAEQAAAAATHDLRTQIHAHTLLGNVALARGDLTAAEAAYQRAVMLLETSDTRRDQAAVGVMLAAIGRLHVRRGDVSDAVALLRSAAARLPRERAVRSELARALASTGESAAAAALRAAR